MIGRVLFMSAAAFVAWRYIGRSNRKVKQLTEARGQQEILPPEPVQPTLSAAEQPSAAKAGIQKLLSRAAENLPGR